MKRIGLNFLTVFMATSAAFAGTSQVGNAGGGSAEQLLNKAQEISTALINSSLSTDKLSEDIKAALVAKNLVVQHVLSAGGELIDVATVKKVNQNNVTISNMTTDISKDFFLVCEGKTVSSEGVASIPEFMSRGKAQGCIEMAVHNRVVLHSWPTVKVVEKIEFNIIKD